MTTSSSNMLGFVPRVENNIWYWIGWNESVTGKILCGIFLSYFIIWVPIPPEFTFLFIFWESLDKISMKIQEQLIKLIICIPRCTYITDQYLSLYFNLSFSVNGNYSNENENLTIKSSEKVYSLKGPPGPPSLTSFKVDLYMVNLF